MNGPEHYREAEKHLRESFHAPIDDGGADHLMAAAQVHATLALVAATVNAAALGSHGYPEWGEVTR